MKRFVLRLLATAALLAAGVRAAAPEPVTHEAAEQKSAVTLRVATQLKIVLPAKGEAGHRWQIVSNDPRVLKPSGEPKPAATAKAGEAAARWEVTFTAQRPGRSILRFVWARPGATDIASPDEFREVTVRVQ